MFNPQAEEGQGEGQGADQDATQLQQARERLSALIPVLYQRLNAVGSSHEAEQQQIGVRLRARPWIWVVGDRFALPSQVAFHATTCLTPYLRARPQDLAVCGKLPRLFRVRRPSPRATTWRSCSRRRWMCSPQPSCNTASCFCCHHQCGHLGGHL